MLGTNASLVVLKLQIGRGVLQAKIPPLTSYQIKSHHRLHSFALVKKASMFWVRKYVLKVNLLELSNLHTYKKDGLVHKTPINIRSQGIVYYTHLILHYKRLFLRLKSVTTKSHCSNFTIVSRLSFNTYMYMHLIILQTKLK